MSSALSILQPRRPSPTHDLAREPHLADTLRDLGRDRTWINQQHLDICRVAAPTFFEEKRANFMVDRFRTLGYEAKLDRAGNVTATLPAESKGPFVALTAHLDTVLSPRSADEIRLSPDGRFLGPGVSDNGAGLAALLAIAKQYALRQPGKQKSNLILVANVGEEGEGNLSGMRYLCRQSPLADRLRSFLVLDGPGVEHITAQALASRRYEVIFSGPGGHSWSDAANPNAVHAACRTISDFLDCHNRRAAFLQTRYGRSTVNFSLIDGGTSINSIPASARAKLDLRSESTEVLEELAILLTDCVERALVTENERVLQMRGVGRLIAKIREIGSRPGGQLASDSALLGHLKTVDTHMGIVSRIDCASTDANIPLSMGLEAVSLGTGGSGGGAHTDAEWYHPEGREIGLRRIYLTLAHLLRS